MNRKELKQYAKQLTEKMEEKEFEFWERKEFPFSEEKQINDEGIQIEYNLLENEENYMHIGLGFSSEGNFIDSFLPVSKSFIVHREKNKNGNDQ